MSKGKVKRSSGNVFADIGVSEPEEALNKSTLVGQIASINRKQGLTQAEVAKQLDLTQPKVSNLLRGEMQGFSVERLLVLLYRLDYEVEIKVRKHRGKNTQAATTVRF